MTFLYPGTSFKFTGSRKGQASSWVSISFRITLQKIMFEISTCSWHLQTKFKNWRGKKYLQRARSLVSSLLGFLTEGALSTFDKLTEGLSSIFLFLRSLLPLLNELLVEAESSSSVSPATVPFLLFLDSFVFFPLTWSFFIFIVWPLAFN